MSPRLVAATVVALVAAALTPAPSARAEGSNAPYLVLDVPDIVLWDGCNRFPVNYSLDPGAPDREWYILTYIGAPNILFHEGVGPSTGVASMQMCDHRPVGQHVVDAYLRPQVGITTWATATATFTVRRPATQTLITVSDRHPRPGQRVQVKLVTMVETPTGFVRDDESVLQLQKRTGKGWKKVDRKKTERGKATTGFRYRGGKVTVRGRSTGSSHDNDTGSFSVTVRIG